MSASTPVVAFTLRNPGIESLSIVIIANSVVRAAAMESTMGTAKSRSALKRVGLESPAANVRFTVDDGLGLWWLRICNKQRRGARRDL